MIWMIDDQKLNRRVGSQDLILKIQKPYSKSKCLAFFTVEIFYRSASNARLSTEEGDEQGFKTLLILTYTMVYTFHILVETIWYMYLYVERI